MISAAQDTGDSVGFVPDSPTGASDTTRSDTGFTPDSGTPHGLFGLSGSTPILGGLLNGIASAAPTVLGTAGNIAGNLAGVTGAVGSEIGGLGPEDPLADAGAAGSLAFGNRVLAPALSGGGQATGEIIKKLIDNVLLGEPNNESFGQNAGDVAKNFGEGAVYGMVPGGQANPLARFGTGALAGGANQVIQDVGTKNPLSDIGGIAKNAALSGSLNTLLPMATSALFEGAPKNIQKNLAISQFGPDAAENPEVAALAHPNPVVSEKNIDLVKGDTADTVNNLLSQKTGNVGQFKQDILKQSGISQSDPRFKEIEDLITAEQQKVADAQNAAKGFKQPEPQTPPPGEQAPTQPSEQTPLKTKAQIQKVKNLPVENRTKINTEGKPTNANGAPETAVPGGEFTPKEGKTPEEVNQLLTAADVKELPLNVLNQIKNSVWSVGKGADNDKSVLQMWLAARGNVKDNFTGGDKQLEALWNKQEALQHAKTNIQKINLTRGAAPGLDSGGMGYISPFLALRIPVIGPLLAAGMMGQRVMRNPGVANSVGKTLEKGQNLEDVIRQLGLRLPGMGNGGQ